MDLAPPGFLGDDQHGGLEVLDSARNVGIAQGAGGFAVTFVVHGPDVVDEPRVDIHHRVFTFARNREVEARLRPFDEPYTRNSIGFAPPAAGALPGGIFDGPERRSGRGGGSRRLGLGDHARRQAARKAGAGRLDHVTARKRNIRSHRFVSPSSRPRCAATGLG